LDKKVFIIVVTYNGEKWLQRHLESLYESVYPVNVLVVDNHSSDNSVAIIKSFSEVKLIESKENLGFGKANNIGMEVALKQGADYVFLLNQDTWIYPDTIGNLVRVAESNKDYGIVSPLHFSSDETTLDENFKTFWNRKLGVISDTIDEVPFVNAAAWLMPKNVIDKVGYFESWFQHYGEDRNYANRMVFHDFKIVVAKESKICHDRQISRNFNKDSVQSKYRILNEVLNINDSLSVSYLKGFRSVFGLPKYFHTYYSFSQISSLFYTLLLYYTGLKIKFFSILKKRASYK
jgi:GT2 family glycosyltransferase